MEQQGRLSARSSDVRLAAVSKSFGVMKVVDNLNLSIERGTFVSLIGPSGCGKTTILRMIAGFETPDEGKIYIREKLVTRVPAYRRNYGMVFQSFALFPHLTVGDNVAFGLKMRGVPKDERARRSHEALELVKLDGLEARYPRQLSGGQQQRVALARAIVVQPAVLLLDEPFGALDKLLRDQMQLELRALQQRLGITTIFVTHDQEEALTMSDTIGVINRGIVEQIGTPSDLYNQPRTKFVATFLGVSNFLEGKVIDRDGTNVRVRSDQGSFEVTDSHLKVGDPVRICVRPEKIKLSQSSTAHSLKTIVKNLTFRGMVTQFQLQCGGVDLVAVQTNVNAPAKVEPGETLWASWDPSSAVVLARD